MSGWTAALLSVIFVINPVGTSRAVQWPARQAQGWRGEATKVVAGAGVILVVLGLLTAPILSLADLSTPTFRLATSVVLGVTGAIWMIRPTPPITEPDTSTPITLGLTMLLAPGPVFAAMSANADGGTAAGVVAVVAGAGACLAALLVPRLPDPLGVWVTRLIGAITIAIAVGIGINSARTV